MNGASALFRQLTRGGSEHVEAAVWIPIGANIDSPEVRWTVWHEIGPAMDQVQTRNDGRMLLRDFAEGYSQEAFTLLCSDT